MRTRPIPVILVALLFISALGSPALAQTPVTASFQSAGTDPARVEAFLKTLQDAIAIDNHMKVASLVKYPLEARIGGETVTLRSDSDLLSRYHQIFDKALKESLAQARVETLSATAEGVAVCGGRLLVRPASEKNASLKIVRIGEVALR